MTSQKLITCAHCAWSGDESDLQRTAITPDTVDLSEIVELCPQCGMPDALQAQNDGV